MKYISSVQFSHSVVSDSLQPHESRHARPPCPSPTPGVHSDSRPSSLRWPSSHLILSRPLLPLPPMPPSIRVLYILNAQLMFSYYFHFEVTCGCSHQKTNRCLKRSVFCFIQPNHLNSDSENNLKTITRNSKIHI